MNETALSGVLLSAPEAEMSTFETAPLLQDEIEGSANSSHEAQLHRKSQHDRTIDNDVFPEVSTVGRTLGWGSCYILVISRVIGRGMQCLAQSFRTSALLDLL